MYAFVNISLQKIFYFIGVNFRENSPPKADVQQKYYLFSELWDEKKMSINTYAYVCVISQ